MSAVTISTRAPSRVAPISEQPAGRRPPTLVRSQECARPAHLELFGGWLLAWGDARADVPIAAQRLIAYLALSGGATRTRVAGTLWPEVSEVRANGSLRSTIWRVNKERPHMLRDTGGVLSLCPDVTVDVIEFTTRARALINLGRGASARELLAHKSGELLPGWYDDWIVFERERFRQLRLHALDVVANSLCEQGRYAEALDAALDALNSDPLRESAHRTVVRIHLAEGNAGEAVRAYRGCRELLATELGVTPSDAFRRLLVDAGIPDAAR